MPARSAARNERVASAGKPKKGNLFARLFGFSTDDEEDEDQPAGNTVVAEGRRKPPAARVPLPQARPQIKVAAREARGRLRARLGDVHAV